MRESFIRSKEETRYHISHISNLPQVILCLRAHHPQSYSSTGLRDPVCFPKTMKSSQVSPKGYCTQNVSDAKQSVISWNLSVLQNLAGNIGSAQYLPRGLSVIWDSQPCLTHPVSCFPRSQPGDRDLAACGFYGGDPRKHSKEAGN